MSTDNTALGYSTDTLAQRKAELLQLIRQTAPELVSDNQIDIEMLKELLGQERIAPVEHYELNWAGKSAARREIQKKTSHTLLPAANNPEHASHMLIEGENLEVLRVLQKSYYGKVKMIYIDPPYNTGNDSFVYPDDYSETLDEYLKRTGEKNEAGFLNKQNLWKRNNKESGQYHSAWLSMMYPRLYLARNLLRDDGVIFISIDDNEATNLKLLCDEIFGAENFAANFIIKSNPRGSQSAAFCAQVHENILCYTKNFLARPEGLITSLSDEMIAEYKMFDAKGKYRLLGLRLRGGSWRREQRPLLYYPIYVNPESETVSLSKSDDHYVEVLPIQPSTNEDGTWRWSKQKLSVDINDIVAKAVNRDGQTVFDIFQKDYLNDMAGEQKGTKPKTIWDEKEANYQNGTNEIKNLFQKSVFDFPKPVHLIKKISKMVMLKEDVVLDFFAGSGTTAQAVMEFNLEDGGNRQCICVQMPEVLEKTTEAYKAGYRTIADITRARIEKVIAKLKVEHPNKTTELACANFTLAPSNFKVWRRDVADADALRAQMEIFQSAEKSPSSQMIGAQTAMLSELLLKNGLGALGVHAISKPKQIAGITVHCVLLQDDRYLWLCFDPYTSALKDEIVNAKPAQMILLNSCFVGEKADEQLSNLQLVLADLDIGLLII